MSTEILQRLLSSVREKRFWLDNAWHDDNTPTQNALKIRELKQSRTHPTFLRLIFHLRQAQGGHQGDPFLKRGRKDHETELGRIPEKSFQKCMQTWQKGM